MAAKKGLSTGGASSKGAGKAPATGATPPPLSTVGPSEAAVLAAGYGKLLHDSNYHGKRIWLSSEEADAKGRALLDDLQAERVTIDDLNALWPRYREHHGVREVRWVVRGGKSNEPLLAFLFWDTRIKDHDVLVCLEPRKFIRWVHAAIDPIKRARSQEANRLRELGAPAPSARKQAETRYAIGMLGAIDLEPAY